MVRSFGYSWSGFVVILVNKVCGFHGRMPKQHLFDDESEEEVEIKTENEYAKKYDQWRGKEEMHKREFYLFAYF